MAMNPITVNPTPAMFPTTLPSGLRRRNLHVFHIIVRDLRLRSRPRPTMDPLLYHTNTNTHRLLRRRSRTLSRLALLDIIPTLSPKHDHIHLLDQVSTHLLLLHRHRLYFLMLQTPRASRCPKIPLTAHLFPTFELSRMREPFRQRCALRLSLTLPLCDRRLFDTAMLGMHQADGSHLEFSHFVYVCFLLTDQPVACALN